MILVALGLAGCSGAEPVAPGRIETTGAYLDAIDRTWAEWLVRCGLAADHAAAEAFVTRTWHCVRDAGFPEAFQAGRITYDPAAAHACVESVANRTCSIREYYSRSAPACERVFRGTVADSGACSLHAECAGGLCSGGKCGTSQREFSAAIGEPCGATSDCVRNAFCDGENDVCTPQQSLGERCSSDYVDECELGLACRPAAGDEQTCQRAATDGAPCSNDYDCDRLDAYCDDDEQVCTRYRVLGQDCRNARCNVWWSRCDTATHTCVPFSDVGEPCDHTDQECLDPLTCVDGRCVDSTYERLCIW